MSMYPQSLKPVLDRIDPTFGRHLNCEQGWWNIIEKMHAEFMMCDPEYRLYQVLEKCGGLRVYFAPSSPHFANDLERIAKRYERVSYTICEITGKAGELMERNGVYKTLCRDFINDGWQPAELVK